MNLGQLIQINDWIIQWKRHRYHRWWQIIVLWFTLLAIKAPVIMRIVLWISGWLFRNQGQMRWIYDLIIQCRRHMYHRWWKLIALWVTVLAIKATIIRSSCSLPTLIHPCSTCVAITNTLWTWHDECNMSLWWCYVPVVLFVVDQKSREPIFLRNNCSHVWVSVPGIKLITRFFSQYNPN